MKYSIIIPHINEGYYLDAMLDSIYLRVKYTDFEIIIIDDGTNNLNDLNFIRSHPMSKRIRVIVSGNRGSAGARNLGSMEARGKYLIFLDAHMYCQEDILTELDKIPFEYDCMQMVVGNYSDKSSRGLIYKIKDMCLDSTWCNPVSGSECIVENPCSSGAATIIRKAVFKNVGGFNPYIRKWGTEDLELPMRLWLRGYTCYLHQGISIAHYFKHKFENTVVEGVDVVFNRIMFAHTCFQNKKRRENILEAMKSAYGYEIFDKGYEMFIKDIKIQAWIKKQQASFQHDDDWYFSKFEKYYPEFILNP